MKEKIRRGAISILFLVAVVLTPYYVWMVLGIILAFAIRNFLEFPIFAILAAGAVPPPPALSFFSAQAPALVAIISYATAEYLRPYFFDKSWATRF